MQNIAIISSLKDPASVNIKDNLLELFDFRQLDEKFEGNNVYEFNSDNEQIRLYLINSDLVRSENIDRRIKADFLVFASKHQSKENTPSFTVHSIGNWGKANLGGGDGKLCHSSAILLKNIFIELNNAAKDSNYEITMEATHHGPYVETPSVFVEIGSTEKEWNEKENGEIIAKTIINAINNENKNYKIAVGLGGTHYCTNFNKIMLKTDIALSFICPKYALQDLNENLIQQAVQKTKEKIDFVLLDWKGLGTEKERIAELIGNLKLESRRNDKL